MKRALILILSIPFFLVFNSCEDALKLLPPDGLVKDNFWKNKEDVESVLMAAYKNFAQMDARLFHYGELRGDMLKEGASLSNELRNIKNGNIYPSNSWANWNPFYAVINKCNLVLKYAPEVKKIDPTFSDYKFNTFNAEAIFLRSLAYFYMVRVWKDVPFILTAYDSDSQDFFIPKTSGDIILDSLKVQLKRILINIPKDHETLERTRGRATNGAVYALMADIALWNFEYQNCIDYVDKVQSNELYNLLSSGLWFTIFSDGNTLEGIFEIQFDYVVGLNNSLYNLTRLQNNNFLASSYALEILAPQISKEIIRGNGSLRAEDGLIWKYVGQRADGLSFRSGSTQNSCNLIIYRLADLMLMKAEALSQLGQYTEALEIINEIRTRAFMDTYGSWQQSPQAFEDLILEERAKELAFEGKRWFDLLRMGRRNSYERKNKLIEIIIENVPATQKRVLASKLSDPNGWYLPIHGTEIENNLNLVQNPYYQIYD